MKKVDLLYAFGLKPERAIAYLESKGMRITFDWHEMLDEAHDKAFTVAKVMRLDILQDLRGAVAETMDKGLTFQDFRKSLEPTLRSKGWWGKKEILNPATGELRMAQLGSVRRLETIYEQNVQTIYSAGRYRSQMDGAASRPFWMFVVVMDVRTSRICSPLAGQIFRYDDPIWASLYPPNHFRCRTRVRALDDAGVIEMTKDGHGVWNAEGSKGRLGSREVTLKDGAVATIATVKIGSTTVATDPGFNYNPGKTAWQPDPAKYDKPLRKLL
jgi:SPP1 gp7 family putative phage head morphogenesis protein